MQRKAETANPGGETTEHTTASTAKRTFGQRAALAHRADDANAQSLSNSVLALVAGKAIH